MGKKRSSKQPTKPMSIRVSEEVYRKIQQLYEASDKPEVTSISGMATALIEEALDRRKLTNEEQMTLLFDHFEKRFTQRFVDLNANLREATGMILIPKPTPEIDAAPELRLETWEHIKHWLDTRFRPISD